MLFFVVQVLLLVTFMPMSLWLPPPFFFHSSLNQQCRTAFDAVEGNKLVTVTIPPGNVAAAGNMEFVLYYGLATGAANNVSVDVLSFVDTQVSGDAFLAVEVSAEGAAVFTNISVEVPAAVNLEYGVEQGVRADNTPSTYTFVGVRSGKRRKDR